MLIFPTKGWQKVYSECEGQKAEGKSVNDNVQ